jgi:hypothetical protein
VCWSKRSVSQITPHNYGGLNAILIITAHLTLINTKSKTTYVLLTHSSGEGSDACKSDCALFHSNCTIAQQRTTALAGSSLSDDVCNGLHMVKE